MIIPRVIRRIKYESDPELWCLCDEDFGWVAIWILFALAKINR